MKSCRYPMSAVGIVLAMALLVTACTPPNPFRAQTEGEQGQAQIEIVDPANYSTAVRGGTIAIQARVIEPRGISYISLRVDGQSDEVDAGIGGAVAEKVGRLLGELATSGQVLCVTHLPQVGAQARQQVRVVKQTDGGTTRTALVALDDAARVEEIARMLGGAQVTDRAREHASEMLGAAGPGPGATPPGRSRSRPADGAGRARGRSGRGGSASGRR